MSNGTTVVGSYKEGKDNSDFSGSAATDSADALMSYYRNLATSAAREAGGSGAVTYIDKSGMAISLALSVLYDAAAGATRTEIIISNGLATLAVKTVSPYTALQNPAVKTALEFALYKFVHDNTLEIMRDPAGWAARAADKAGAAADTIGGTGTSDGSGVPLGWKLGNGSGDPNDPMFPPGGYDRTRDPDAWKDLGGAATLPLTSTPFSLISMATA